MAAIVEVEDEVDGRKAADRLANDWENRDWVPVSPSPVWARAAVIRFGEIMAEQPSIFQASMKRADKGASTLSPRPFQGILECLQNADDLGAQQLRVAFRNRGRPELLIVHDGEPVTFANVGAMMIPWLSTKDGDADAAGRFGIGQRTLNALGGPIELHASPFHLVMDTDGPRPCDPESDVPRVYDGSRRDTMLVIPLSPKVTSEAIAGAVGELSAESLIFLTSIRELTYNDLEDPACNLRFTVEVEHVHQGSVDFDGTPTEVAVHDVRVVAGATSGLAPSFRRYSIRRPVPAGEARANKETGATTPLGICAPLTGGRPRGLYDRMPLPMPTGLLIGLNAQFDPDAARSTLIPNDWNLARMKDLGRLVGWAALDAFARETAIGWTHVPLASEAGGEDDWIDAAA
ncbi:sacsin N-terminal ATP-binding-like domain-containing protein [Sphingomonas faeni]|uniref:sacsin N-terminal ATP-binding-like domain-containing protein n=1 Tax=Sphingomonas faeni TaxID=185950 RepID=UPI00334E6D62